MTSLQPPIIAGERSGNIYTQTFWLAYVANVLLVNDNALTYRFVEFINWLGGTEALTGQIVSVGMRKKMTSQTRVGRLTSHSNSDFFF